MRLTRLEALVLPTACLSLTMRQVMAKVMLMAMWSVTLRVFAMH